MITKLLKDASCSGRTVRLRALFGSIDEQNSHLIQEYRDKHCHFSAGEVLH